MSTHQPPQPVTDYVAALIQSSAQIGSIIAQMERFASRSGAPRTRPTVAIGENLYFVEFDDDLPDEAA